MPHRPGPEPHVNPTQRARLFFALWPDAGVRVRLAEARDVLHAIHGGCAMQADSLHLTLAFLGDVELSLLPGLRGLARECSREPFTLALDRVGCWRHNHIAWAGASHTPEPLSRLVTGLTVGLTRMGVHPDGRPYTPHVTLLRNAECQKENPALKPIEWVARDFVLVRSTLRADGARYEEVGRWPLPG